MHRLGAIRIRTAYTGESSSDSRAYGRRVVEPFLFGGAGDQFELDLPMPMAQVSLEAGEAAQ
jgi:hypothetical protein